LYKYTKRLEFAEIPFFLYIKLKIRKEVWNKLTELSDTAKKRIRNYYFRKRIILNKIVEFTRKTLNGQFKSFYWSDVMKFMSKKFKRIRRKKKYYRQYTRYARRLFKFQKNFIKRKRRKYNMKYFRNNKLQTILRDYYRINKCKINNVIKFNQVCLDYKNICYNSLENNLRFLLLKLKMSSNLLKIDHYIKKGFIFLNFNFFVPEKNPFILLKNNTLISFNNKITKYSIIFSKFISRLKKFKNSQIKKKERIKIINKNLLYKNYVFYVLKNFSKNKKFFKVLITKNSKLRIPRRKKHYIIKKYKYRNKKFKKPQLKYLSKKLFAILLTRKNLIVRRRLKYFRNTFKNLLFKKSLNKVFSTIAKRNFANEVSWQTCFKMKLSKFKYSLPKSKIFYSEFQVFRRMVNRRYKYFFTEKKSKYRVILFRKFYTLYRNARTFMQNNYYNKLGFYKNYHFYKKNLISFKKTKPFFTFKNNYIIFGPRKISNKAKQNLLYTFVF